MQKLEDYIASQHAGDRESAAARLGVSRATIYNNLRYGRVLEHELYTCRRLNKKVKK